MASTGLNDINKLTPDNGAVKDLRELLFLAAIQSEALEGTLTVMPGVFHGDKVAGVGEMGAVGTKQSGCRPTYNSTAIATQEKTWALGEFTVAEEICYKDLEATLVRYAMKKKTDVADLIGTDFVDIIVEPTLQKALEKMMWRLMWFGDTAADNIASGGVITAGVNPELFKVCDGLFKKLMAVTASTPERKVTVAANAEASKALQTSKIREEGVAMKIFEDLVYGADMRLRQAGDKVILCTQSMADALAIDVKRITGSELQWESLFDGLISATKWNGQEILALPRWDEMIAAFEDKGTTLNKPHRAVFASKGTLWGGVESSDMIAQLKIWFSDDDQVNRMIARDKVGAMVWDENLIQFAY